MLVKKENKVHKISPPCLIILIACFVFLQIFKCIYYYLLIHRCVYLSKNVLSYIYVYIYAIFPPKSIWQISWGYYTKDCFFFRKCNVLVIYAAPRIQQRWFELNSISKVWSPRAFISFDPLALEAWLGWGKNY